MEALSYENIATFVGHLSIRDYLNCRQVSKTCREKLDHEKVWFALRQAYWPELPKVQSSWKKLGWSIINVIRGRFYSLGEIKAEGLQSVSSLRWIGGRLYGNSIRRGMGCWVTEDLKVWDEGTMPRSKEKYCTPVTKDLKFSHTPPPPGKLGFRKDISVEWGGKQAWKWSEPVKEHTTFCAGFVEAMGWFFVKTEIRPKGVSSEWVHELFRSSSS